MLEQVFHDHKSTKNKIRQQTIIGGLKMNNIFRKSAIMIFSVIILIMAISMASAYQCNDSIDNDGDGKIDLADPGCTSRIDNSEINPQCNDGIDNDIDGKIDMADSGCDSLTDNDENVVLAHIHGCFNAGDQLFNKLGVVTYFCDHTSCPDVCVLVTEFGNYSTVPSACGPPLCAYQMNGTNTSSVPITMGVKPLALDGGSFGTQNVILEITLNKMAQLNLRDNNKGTTSNLCALCNQFKKTKIFGYGLNNYTLIASALPHDITKELIFIIDNKKPLITKQLPLQNKYINESTVFTVAYTEDFLTGVTLTFGNKTLGYKNKTVVGCINGTKVNCSTKLTNSDIAKFENGTMEYWFNMKDIGGAVKSGSAIKEFVDLHKPVINYFNATPLTKNPKMINFTLSVNEKFLDKVEYKDFKNKSTTMCTTLKSGICQKSISFNTGFHNVTVIVKDKIGNNVTRNAAFNII
jgi:hypothetical protein